MSVPRPSSARALLDLDARLDALAAGRPVDEDGLVKVAARLASLPEAVWDEVAAPYRSPARGQRRLRRLGHHDVRRPVVLAVAAAVVGAAVAAGLALAGGGSPAPARAGNWELAGYVDQPAWGASAAPGAGGVPVEVTCPEPSTCYADQPGVAPGGTVIEVTHDRGTRWSTLGLPAGNAASTPVSCTASGNCAVGAVGPSGGEVLSTNGGAGWASSPLPDPAATLVGVACSPTGDCTAVGHDPVATSTGTDPPVAFHSTDGGAHWSSVTMPGPFVMGGIGGYGALGCSAQDCVAVGLALGHGTIRIGAVRYSNDGGATWAAGSLPPGVGAITAVSCAGEGRCLAVGASQPTGPAGGQVPLEALTTVDGGRTWSVAGPFVTGGYAVDAVSCPTPTACWAAGATTGSGGGLLAVTRDGGATWAPVSLPEAPVSGSGLTSLDLMWVPSVSCPATDACLAIGLRGTLRSAAPPVALRTPG